MSLVKTDRQLAALYKKVHIASLNPSNTEKEKKKVFADSNYNPKFTYNKAKRDYKTIEKQLGSLHTDNTIYGKLLKEKIKESNNLLQLMKSLGKKKFTDYSLKLYGKPTLQLVKEAKRILNQRQEELWLRYSQLSKSPFVRKHNSRLSVTKRFSDDMAVRKYNWKIKEKDMAAGAAISNKEKTLFVNRKRNFTEHDVNRLVVHEIGTHIRRAEEGKKKDYKLFSYGFPNYLETEEGFAAYNEYISGFLSPRILRTYAGRVLATHLALKNSFSVVYNHLLEYFPRGEAWILALRAKRGLGNTREPGGYTKDHLYLKGFLRVKQFAEQGGDVKKLYVGKIGIEHIPLLKSLLR